MHVCHSLDAVYRSSTGSDTPCVQKPVPEGLRLCMPNHLSLGDGGVGVSADHKTLHASWAHYPGCAYVISQRSGTCARCTDFPSAPGSICAGTRSEPSNTSGSWQASKHSCVVEGSPPYLLLTSPCSICPLLFTLQFSV